MMALREIPAWINKKNRWRRFTWSHVVKEAQGRNAECW